MPPVSPNFDCAARMRFGRRSSSDSATCPVSGICVAAARAMAASRPVVPHTPQLEPAEKRRAGVLGTICTVECRRTLTTFGRRVLDSMASMSAA